MTTIYFSHFMKNKKNIYFLLPAVLLIWGLLGYRIFSAVQPIDTSTNLKLSENAYQPTSFKETETFTIKVDYRDPFLGATLNTQKSTAKRSVKTAQEPTQPFPQIVYKGVVSGQGNKEQVFIISIDGKQFFFKKNQTFNGVQLRNGSVKSITLKFQGQQQSFPINN